jgi:hypothetical protein
VLAVALALASCNAPSNGAQPPDSETARHDDSGTAEDAGAIDASSMADARNRADAGSSGHDAALDASQLPADSGGGSGGGSGTVSCGTAGNPGASCTLPVHCCFTNYSSQHDGSCMTSACSWGTVNCDGPEDCATGQHCCAHVLVDPEIGILGYKLACQSAACGPAPANQELCHPSASAAGTCSTASASCVAAFGNDSDLPPSLHICQ